MAFDNPLYPKGPVTISYPTFSKSIRMNPGDVNGVDLFTRQCAYNVYMSKFKGIINFKENRVAVLEPDSVYKIHIPIKRGFFNTGRFSEDNTRWYCWEYFVFIKTFDKGGTLSLKENNTVVIRINITQNSYSFYKSGLPLVAYPVKPGQSPLYFYFSCYSWDFPFTVGEITGYECGTSGYGLYSAKLFPERFFLDETRFKIREKVTSCYDIYGINSRSPTRWRSLCGWLGTYGSDLANTQPESKNIGVAYKTALFNGCRPSSYCQYAHSPSLTSIFKYSCDFNLPFVVFGWADPWYEDYTE